MRQCFLKIFNQFLRDKRRRQFVTIFALLGIASSSAANGFSVFGKNRQIVKSLPVKSKPISPVRFEPNQGQFADNVKFVAQSSGENAFLTADKAVFAVPMPDQNKQENLEMFAFSMKLNGANVSGEFAAGSQSEGTKNYFKGSDPQKWCQNVPNYSELTQKNVYDGVDLKWHGAADSALLEYDFVIAPNADFKKIEIEFQGIEALTLDDNGDLLIQTPAGLLRQAKPVSYQDFNGAKNAVMSRYELRGANKIGFTVGDYDTRKPLTIDPTLNYSTYLGGAERDGAQAVAVDAGGSAYATGFTFAADFPVTTGAVFKGQTDTFVTKFNASGGLVYSTIFGGSSTDIATQIKVDSSGRATVAGRTTSNDFSTVAGSFNITPQGDFDAFVTQLSANGTALIYSGLLGGSVEDQPFGLALDSAGNAYVTGSTTSSNFPTVTPYQAVYAGSIDGFVSKISADGRSILYSTYLGGLNSDAGGGIAVDSANNIYVTGYTYSLNFPTTVGAYSQTLTGLGSVDAFVTKIAANGSALTYSTYIGGNNPDMGRGIAVDSGGNAFITGATSSTNYPTTAGAFDTTLKGGADAFVTKLAPTGASLVYSTYVGGGNIETGESIALDSSGKAYLTGVTGSTDLPMVAAYDNTLNSTYDAYTTVLSADGRSSTFSTYLGGDRDDYGYGIAVDSLFNIYLVGITVSTNFPTLNAYDASFNNNGDDAFVTKFSSTPTSAEVSLGGRILTTGGKGLMNSRVIVTNGRGESRSMLTSSFGNFHFDGLTAGQTVVISVASKRFTFVPQVITLTDSISGLTFTAQ